MINRQNYQDVQDHLNHRREICRDAEGTQANRWSALRLMLIWADESRLSQAAEIVPTFPAFLAGQERDGEPLAASTLQGMVAAARTFFRWALTAHPRRYRSVTPLWIDSLKAPEVPEAAPARDLYTLEDVRRLCSDPDGSLRCERIRAPVAFLFLSGMRVGAFVTLPIGAVDIQRREVRQWTSLGVHTKFSKSATTFLLEIPDLLEIVQRWDARVRSALPAGAMWYPNLSMHPHHKHVVDAPQTRSRAHGLRNELKTYSIMMTPVYHNSFVSREPRLPCDAYGFETQGGRIVTGVLCV